MPERPGSERKTAADDARNSFHDHADPASPLDGQAGSRTRGDLSGPCGVVSSAIWIRPRQGCDASALRPPPSGDNRMWRRTAPRCRPVLQTGLSGFAGASWSSLLRPPTRRLPGQLQRALARYEGLHLIAFSHADLEAQRARLVTRGFEMQSMVRLPGRTGEEVSWSVLRTLPHVMPEGRIQFVYPHTPELSWPPGTTGHPNHADSLTGVVVCASEPDEAKDRFAAYLGRETDSDGLATDRGRVHIVGPEDAGDILPGFLPPSLPCIAAVTVMTTDLDETRGLSGTTALCRLLDLTAFCGSRRRMRSDATSGSTTETRIPRRT